MQNNEFVLTHEKKLTSLSQIQSCNSTDTHGGALQEYVTGPKGSHWICFH